MTAIPTTCGIEAVIAAAIKLRAAAGTASATCGAFDDSLEAERHRELVSEASKDVVRAALALDLAAALEINDALCQHTYYTLGLRDEPAPSTAAIPLLELAGASRLVRGSEHDVRVEGGRTYRTLHTVMDDRAVAAIHAINHYDAVGPDELGDGEASPVAEVPGKGMFVLRFRREGGS